MNKSIDEARKLMCAQKVSERSDNKVLAIKTHAAIRASHWAAGPNQMRINPALFRFDETYK